MGSGLEFVRQDLTSYGGLELVRRIFRLLDLHGRLGRAFRAYGPGGDYGCGRLVLLVVALFLVGARRLEHLRYIRPRSARRTPVWAGAHSHRPHRGELAQAVHPGGVAGGDHPQQ